MKLGIVMDPIASINIKKDSSFAMLLEAQRRGWQIYYIEQADLFCQSGVAYADTQTLHVSDDAHNWYQLSAPQQIALSELDVILMRIDPPFNMNYIYTTYLLELAERAGTLIVNKPQSLRDTNEKFAIEWFPDLCPHTLISHKAELIKAFIKNEKEIVLKPLGGMGGVSIFRVNQHNPNINVIIETLTEFGTTPAMAQTFIPEITQGDKRILLIDGVPVPYALARIPAKDDFRGNLAAGGRGEGIPLGENDRRICAQIGPELKKRGLLFVGIDVIGDYLTEINVTSPTCIRELDKLFNLNISAILLDAIENQLKR